MSEYAHVILLIYVWNIFGLLLFLFNRSKLPKVVIVFAYGPILWFVLFYFYILDRLKEL